MTEVTPFIGLNKRTGQEIEVPDHFITRHGEELAETRNTFSDVIHDLPRAYSTDVAFKDPETDEWVEIGDTHHAVFDPDKDHDEHPVWDVMSDQYSIVNPSEFYTPLENKLMDEDITNVFGTVRTEKRGGEGYVNLMFSDKADVPDEATNALYTGIRSGYSHIGTMACWAEGFAQDGQCSNSMYGLTNRRSRRHVGSAQEEVVEWWGDILESYGALPDHLADMIRDALDFEITIGDLPFDQWNDFYGMYYPEYMARAAASHALSRSDSPVELNAWQIHVGATYAITHTFSGNEESDTKDEYIAVANDMLQNPALFIDETRREYERRLEMQDEDEPGIYSEEGLQMLEEQSESIEDLKEEYQSNQEEMQNLMTVEVEGDEDE